MISFHNWISFFSRLTFCASYGLPLSTHRSFFCTSELICGFSPQLIRKRLQKIIIKRPTRRLLWLGFSSETLLHCCVWLIDTAWRFFSWYVPFDFYIDLCVNLLQANVLTGLINLTILTMYTSDVWAMIILVLYSITLFVVPRFVTNFRRTRR